MLRLRRISVNVRELDYLRVYRNLFNFQPNPRKILECVSSFLDASLS